MPPPTTDIVVVNPRDGTILDNLNNQPSDLLAAVAHDLRAREKQLAEMRKAVEAVLLGRLEQEGRRLALVGDYEIQVDTGRGRVWDGEDLEHALRELVDAGTLQAGELTGLIRHETKVDGKAAVRLLGLLSGRPRGLVEACFRWETKGRPRLTVTPSVQLLEEPEA